MKTQKYRLLFVFVVLISSRTVWGFAEMVRYGYENCTACHVSPDGGEY